MAWKYVILFGGIFGAETTGNTDQSFAKRLRQRLERLNGAEIKSPRALLVSKTRDRGMCADRPMGNQCCAGSDWNCQPPNSICSCDQHCREMGDCCPDYNDTCGNIVEKEAVCERTGTARANGDPHYHSFDMKMIHFQGKCSYILSKNCSPGKEDFKIVAKNEVRYGNNDMSWTKDIFIKYGDIKIEVNKNRLLKLNGVRFYPPFGLPDGTVIDKTGNYISVTTYFGITLFYDGDGNAEVKATCDWHGKLCGLLGNFNGNSGDDMIGIDGEIYDDKTGEAFGESWRHWDNSPGCQLEKDTIVPATPKWQMWIQQLANRPNFDGLTPMCTDQQFDAAVQKCNIIQSERHKFAVCHEKVNPSTFFENCVWDQCSTKEDPSVFCDSVATYARACADFDRPVNWRSKTLCPARCPIDSHYEYCGPNCIQTCQEPKRKTCPQIDGKCTEGCYCNKGYLWDGLKCVRKETCGCVHGDNSYLIGQKYFTKDCAEKCTCTGIGASKCLQIGKCSGNKKCEINEENEYFCKPPGMSMQLGKKPKLKTEKTTTTTTVSTTTTKATTTVSTTIALVKKNDTKIQHDDGGSMSFGEPEPDFIGPFVLFPECLPKYTWVPGRISPDWIPPNACCGNRPYNDEDLKCCNNRFLFDETKEKCCRQFGQVIPKDEKCKFSDFKTKSPKVINAITLDIS